MKKLLRPIILCSFLPLLTFSSCKKEDDAPAPQPQPVIQPINPDTTTVIITQDPLNSPDRYLPLAVGNTWNYTDDLAGTFTETVTKKEATNNRTTFTSVSTYLNPVDNSERTIFVENGKYYLKFSIDSLAIDLEVLALDESKLNKGDKWSETKPVNFEGFPINLVIQGEVIEKLTSYTSNGITYTDVIAIKNTVGIDPNQALLLVLILRDTGIEIPSGGKLNSITSYYARGVGLIKSYDESTNSNTLLVSHVLDTEIK